MLNVLDYGEHKPFGETVGKPRNLAWPVSAYRVTLPELSGYGDINPFERVILKIIEACGIRNADALARETCLPVDLVQCILLRLKDKALVDEHCEIIREKSGTWAGKDEENEQSFVTALLFRETVSGKILPFLHLLDKDNPLKKNEDDEKRYQKIQPRHINNKPEPHDVIRAIKAMSRRSGFGTGRRLPAVRLISIAGESEPYYLDCPIAIQKRDGEFRIADPFGSGFSLLLESVFSRLLEQDENLSKWLMEWRQNLSNPTKNEQNAAPKEAFENDTNWGRYRNLISCMRLKKDTQYRSIKQIYSAIEWALFYACTQRRYDNAVRTLRLSKQEDHKNILKEAAKELGLDSPQNGFFPVPEGKLDDFESGEPDMSTILSITLLMAKEDRSHPLHRIAIWHQDFINGLLRIKKQRDEQDHGKGGSRKDMELPEEAFMRKIVTTLLPDIRFSDTPAAEIDKDKVADKMLDARTSILNEFAFEKYNRLGTNLKDWLIAAESFLLSFNDGDDANIFVCDLCAVLQAVFRKKLAGALPPDVTDSEFTIHARESAKNAGFGELPPSLCTVRPLMVRQTLQGNDQTLNACAVVFLIVSGNEDLKAIAELQPSFISDINDIIVLRGHGNEPLPMSKDNIMKIRKSVYTTIKTLLEV